MPDPATDFFEEVAVLHDDELYQAIREVPGAFIGDLWDGSGLHNVLASAVALSVAAYLAGRCTRLDVTLRNDGAVELRSEGCGVLGADEGDEFLCSGARLRSGPSRRYPPQRDPVFCYGRGAGLGSVIIPEAAAAVSDYFTADFLHGDGRRHLAFRQGRLVESRSTPAVGQPVDTVLRFRPDPLVFPDVTFDTGKAESHLRELSFLLPGLTITLCDERADATRRSFDAPRGIADLLGHLVGDRPAVPPRPIVLAAEHSDEIGPLLRIEMAFCWTDSLFEDLRGYTNASYNRHGGVHVSSLRRSLPGCLRTYAEEAHLLGADDPHFHPDTVREGLTAVVSVWHCQPSMESSMGHKLCSSDVVPVARSMVTEQFEDWLWTHPDEARAIVTAVLDRDVPSPAIG